MLKYITVAMFALSLQAYAATATTSIATSTPVAPSNMQARLEGSTTQDYIVLTWDDNSSNETLFALEKRITPRVAGIFPTATSTPSSSATFTPFAFVQTNQRFYIFASTTPDTLFTFRVRAYNNAGYSAYSNQSAVITSKRITRTLPVRLIDPVISITK